MESGSYSRTVAQKNIPNPSLPCPWDVARDWLCECDAAGVKVSLTPDGKLNPSPPPGTEQWAVWALEADHF